MLDFLLGYGLCGTTLLAILGLAALLSGGEMLVRGASRLAMTLGMPPFVVGLTIVALGTSSPELAVSLASALHERGDMAIGTIFGSNICNICFVLGLAALLKPVRVTGAIIRHEISLMIVVNCLIFVMAFAGGFGTLLDVADGNFEGHFSRLAGGMLTVGLVIYLLWMVRRLYRHPGEDRAFTEQLESGIQHREESALPMGRSLRLLSGVCGIIIGVGLLLIGSDMLIKGGMATAKGIGISDLVVGLTLLAAGTSLPELAVTIIATLRGKGEIAVGNVIGSNIVNILGVLGITALCTPSGLDVPKQAMQFDIPVVIVVSLFCIILCFTGRRINRAEGMFLLLVYAVYIGFLGFVGR